MPYRTFMKSFVPDPRVPDKRFQSGRTDIFKDMPTPKNESEMYREIPKRLNRGLCRGFVVVLTPHEADSASLSTIAPDCGIYPRDSDRAPQVDNSTQYSRTDWSYIEITIACKKYSAEDPFDDTRDNAEPNAIKRKSALGQILSYADLLLQNQHRKHHFMIIFLGTSARIIRIDRASIFATQRFNYIEQEEYLTDFLWRYARLSAAQRGFDPSAHRLHPRNTRDPLVQLMRTKLHDAKDKKIVVEPHILEAYENSLDEDVPWWKLEVHDEDQDVSRVFVVGKPHFLASGLRGRGTRCYIAQEVLREGAKLKLGDFVYLKDAWRVKQDEIEKEGTTLKYLNTHKVPHVPTVVCHGDLPDQLTISRAIWLELNTTEDYCLMMTEHQHYRLVVEEIGKPLSQFKNSRELVRALCNVVEAHEVAYHCGIIHRDISGGNILLYRDKKGRWHGLLTNWELAKDIHKTSHKRQPERVGTWQFMSAHVQNNPSHVVVIADELESVFHVLISYTVRFCHHTLPNDNVGQFLYDYFDSSAPFSLGRRSGRTKRNAVKQGAISLETYTGFDTPLLFIWPTKTPGANQDPDFGHPLNRIIAQLLSWFQAHYALDALANAEFNSQDPSPDHRKDGEVDAGDDDDVAPDVDLASDDDSDDDSGPLAMDSEKIKRRAAQLATHCAMLKLLKSELQKGKMWPNEDEKTKDQRPNDGYVCDRDPESLGLPPAFFGIHADEPQDSTPEASQGSATLDNDGDFAWEESKEDIKDEDEDEGGEI